MNRRHKNRNKPHLIFKRIPGDKIIKKNLHGTEAEKLAVSVAENFAKNVGRVDKTLNGVLHTKNRNYWITDTYVRPDMSEALHGFKINIYFKVMEYKIDVHPVCIMLNNY